MLGYMRRCSKNLETRQTPNAESAAAIELLETFRTIAQVKRTYPAESIRNYIISGAESENDVLAVVAAGKIGRRPSRRIGRTIPA